MQIDIRITEDKRKAHLILIADEKNVSEELTINELKNALSKAGVVKGIKENILDQICRSKVFGRRIIIAEAIPPEKGKDGKIQIKVEPEKRSTYDKGIDAEKRVDHYGKREGFYTYVEEDAILATYKPPTRGKNGFTVTGEEIEGILGKDVAWKNIQGKNTKIISNNLIALKSGVLKKEDSKLNIEQIIMLEQDLGIKTGSIVLPLEADIDMIVPGDIKSGFTVQCHKITVMGNVEDAKVTANILEVKRGIIGTSDLPIAADNLITGFIDGKRKIKSKFINVTKEISGGSTIQADFVRSHVIQECSITARYGIWVDYLYGSNDFLVGIDIDEQTEYNNWIEQLDGVDKALIEIKESNKSLIKKGKSIKEMKKRMPNNPAVNKEFEKLCMIEDKINKIEKITEALKRKLQLHQSNMYVGGSPFILIQLGFTKKVMTKEKVKIFNNFTIKEFPYEKSKPFIAGIYTLRNEEVIGEQDYNVQDIKDIMENYRNASLN